MKKYYSLFFITFLLLVNTGCENTTIQKDDISKTALIEYCEENDWYIGIETSDLNELNCYFPEKSCNALAYYNGECSKELENDEDYDELEAIQKCTELKWEIWVIDDWFNEIKMCFFEDESLCSLWDLYNWTCKWEELIWEI